MSQRGSQSALSWRQLGDPWTLLSTGLGCGLAPIAPGTVGSLLGAAIWWFVFADLDYYLRASAAFATFFAGVLIVEAAVQRHGLADDPAIVLDEVVGVWFALLFAPKSLPWVAGAFVLFRIADVVKPWPVSRIDTRVAGGLGIMADDLVAGLMAAAVAFAVWFGVA
ncbi:MAG: phosphatidylglycerophosphatase A [Pseudomonadales bacterium]|nr:phosphatidylglycerophosphatase A [Pseudomonadales bacterium]